MNVGQAGTGIGGLFYLLTVLLIFFYELFKKIRQVGSKRKWNRALEQLGISTSMVLSAIITNEFLGWFLGKRPIPSIDEKSANITAYAWHYAQVHPILIPIFLLIIVMCSVQLTYLWSQSKLFNRAHKIQDSSRSNPH